MRCSIPVVRERRSLQLESCLPRHAIRTIHVPSSSKIISMCDELSVVKTSSLFFTINFCFYYGLHHTTDVLAPSRDDVHGTGMWRAIYPAVSRWCAGGEHVKGDPLDTATATIVSCFQDISSWTLAISSFDCSCRLHTLTGSVGVLLSSSQDATRA